MMASQGWKMVQVHVPMIKFRKGGLNRASAAATAAPSAPGRMPASQPKSAGNATGPNVVALPTIQDFQLPPKFQRRSIDEKEIAFINRGGPE